MGHVDALLRYIEQELKEWRQVRKREAAGKKVDRKVRAVQLVQEPKAWEGVMCPTDVG
jgi:hypothetical protein